MRLRKRTPKRLPRYSGLYIRVFSDVWAVVTADKPVVPHRLVCNKRRCDYANVYKCSYVLLAMFQSHNNAVQFIFIVNPISESAI
jgi:hypothetical protein